MTFLVDFASSAFWNFKFDSEEPGYRIELGSGASCHAGKLSQELVRNAEVLSQKKSIITIFSLAVFL